MPFTISPQLVERLLCAVKGAPTLDYPFVTKDGKTYLRYDELRFTFAAQDMKVEMYWKGAVIATMGVDATFTSGSTMNLTGMEGRQRIELT